MANGILVLVEHQDGRPKKTAFELLSKAAELNIGPVSAAVIGPAGMDLTAALASYGASTVYHATGDAFAQFQSGPWARALETIIRQADPVAVLAPASSIGKDLMPRVATRFRAGLAADCTELSAAGGRLSGRRPVYAGKAVADVSIPNGLQFFSIRPNSFTVGAASGGGSAKSVAVNVSLTDADQRAKLVEVVKGKSEKVDLTEADRIVSGGRSLGSAEAFKVLDELASVIGATVGASRAAVDAGYAPHDMQVGQTGKTVNPTLYMAFGISGAIQHLAGMRSSKVIVAINKDPDAPIFQIADYGIVADLFQAAPALTQEFKKLLSH
jgi:electron transfer flavoprotein alpha subunit